MHTITGFCNFSFGHYCRTYQISMSVCLCACCLCDRLLARIFFSSIFYRCYLCTSHSYVPMWSRTRNPTNGSYCVYMWPPFVWVCDPSYWQLSVFPLYCVQERSLQTSDLLQRDRGSPMKTRIWSSYPNWIRCKHKWTVYYITLRHIMVYHPSSAINPVCFPSTELDHLQYQEFPVSLLKQSYLKGRRMNR